MWSRGGRVMGPSALLGVIVLVAIEFALNGGALTGGRAQADPTFHARLERGPCLGPCPAYRVDIDAQGSVTFVGGEPGRTGYGVCKGPVRWRIAPASVARLQALVAGAGFFRLKENYQGSITDQPLHLVTITSRGRTKRVRDYAGAMAGMPAAVTALEDAIDEAADDRRCIGTAAHPLRGAPTFP